MSETLAQGANALVPRPLPAKHSATWGAIASVFLGALVIYGVGFAPGILHGQAHDSRHTLGFVCH